EAFRLRSADLLIWYSALLLASVAATLVLLPTDAVFGIGLALLTLFLARADLQRFELPDLGNIALGCLGLAWIVASSTNRTDDLIDAFARASAAASTLMTIRIVYRILRKVEGLGLGDVKLAATGAIWLPWSQIPIALLLAAVAGVAGVVVMTLQ